MLVALMVFFLQVSHSGGSLTVWTFLVLSTFAKCSQFSRIYIVNSKSVCILSLCVCVMAL